MSAWAIRYANLSQPVRFLLATLLALAVWSAPSKGAHLASTGALVVAAVVRRRRGSDAWNCAAGWAFMGSALFIVAMIPFGADPGDSLASLGKYVTPLAMAYAIPVLFDTEERVRTALLASATAVTMLFAVDAVRLWTVLGSRTVELARFIRPYALNHPNVASVLAAAAVIVLAGNALRHRPRSRAFALHAAAAAVNLFYLWTMASRGPQAAFAASAFAFGAALPGFWRKTAWFSLAAATVIAGIFLVDRINPRFLESDVLAGRDKVWSHTWALTRERPLLGYGFGKEVFRNVYYSTHPPESPFYYPHAHNYWLKLLFESGWIGVTLHAAAWALLVARLVRHIGGRPHVRDRLLPASALMLMALVLVYGLGDFPDHLLRNLQIWLIPVALTLSRRTPSGEPSRSV
jgi:O-antigen ligase